MPASDLGDASWFSLEIKSKPRSTKKCANKAVYKKNTQMKFDSSPIGKHVGIYDVLCSRKPNGLGHCGLDLYGVLEHPGITEAS